MRGKGRKLDGRKILGRQIHLKTTFGILSSPQILSDRLHPPGVRKVLRACGPPQPPSDIQNPKRHKDVSAAPPADPRLFPGIRLENIKAGKLAGSPGFP